MSMNRREVLQGFGLFGVGLLFRRKGRPETELFDTPEEPAQLPSAAEILAVPQRPFRVQRIVIPDDIAPHFVIEDIRINAVAQLVDGGSAIPGEIFTPRAFAPEPLMLSLDSCGAGQEIRFRVRNISKEPRRFLACLFGQVADGRVMPLAIDSAAMLAPTTAPTQRSSFWSRVLGRA